MAEYINQERLIGRLHNAEENYKADHDYDIDNDPFSDGILSAMFSVNQIVGSEPRADVVEREKIDNAIGDTYEIRREVLYNDNGCYEPNDVLDIIDQIIKLFEEL